MENGDGIKIKLTGKLWLTEAGRAQFKLLGPSEVYHEFDISLKKYLEKAAGINGVIGTENIQYIYIGFQNQMEQKSIQKKVRIQTQPDLKRCRFDMEADS